MKKNATAQKMQQTPKKKQPIKLRNRTAILQLLHVYSQQLQQLKGYGLYFIGTRRQIRVYSTSAVNW